jgi:hypothetical protein
MTDRTGGGSGVNRAHSGTGQENAAVLAGKPPPAVPSSSVRGREVVGNLAVPVGDLLGDEVGSECHFGLL